MTKADKIANFIKENNPRRKDIIKYIVVTLNGANEEYFDTNKNEFRGYYSVNFQQWNRNQKIVKDVKTNRYSVTSYYERDGRLYSMPIEVTLEILKRSNKGLRQHAIRLSYENRILKRQITKASEALKDIIS
jgi:hypothetical protein